MLHTWMDDRTYYVLQMIDAYCTFAHTDSIRIVAHLIISIAVRSFVRMPGETTVASKIRSLSLLRSYRPRKLANTQRSQFVEQ